MDLGIFGAEKKHLKTRFVFIFCEHSTKISKYLKTKQYQMRSYDIQRAILHSNFKEKSTSDNASENNFHLFSKFNLNFAELLVFGGCIKLRAFCNASMMPNSKLLYV